MDSIENVIGYQFTDPRILAEALTHASVSYETQRPHADNQRLEFLGDAVLQLTLSHELYRLLPDADEGILTKARAQLVSTKALAQLARALCLGKFIRMGRGEEANGGRDRDNSLADSLESLTGAIYLDGGLDAARTFILSAFDSELTRLTHSPLEQNPKGQLQEMIQAVASSPPTYAIISESGPDHFKDFEATVTWQGRLLGRGRGRSKKEAEIEAARTALEDDALPALLRETSEP